MDMRIQIDNAVESMREEIFEFLQHLIQIPSENPLGEYGPISEFLHKALLELGFEVQVVNVPEERVKQEGLPTPRINVIATMRGSGQGRSLVFNAHLDTVPAGNPAEWTYPPFSGERANGKIYGRGATDSKGRLAAYIMSAVALKRSGIPFRGNITIAATCDEETGGVLGAGYVNEQGMIEGDMVVVEGYSNQIVRAMAGVMQLRIQSIGVPAHAAFKWKGVNAVEKMAAVIQGLSGLQRELERETSAVPGMRYTSLNMGLIHGGSKVNVVPGYCELEVDFRIIPEHSLDDIYTRVEAVIQGLMSRDPQMNIRIHRITEFQTEPTITGEDSPLIAELQTAISEVTGAELPVVGMLGQSDTRWFVKHGIPGINFGPGTNDNNIHGYDEFMDMEDLIQTTKILTVLQKNVVV
ncbi:MULTISPECIES: ArgE/DapE family deacylase [unclassified Paenibacillus]|uniref:M20 family metallopeptidase n=1 Tax=unclassified Paenibacillus TaxID=185978 RepID=UPI0024070DEA|nr:MULTISPECIES: ArgE/DapE family deacylase [unclassified Paenibacillus]MDF9839402.1 succinyl-diaminopimelate desuccinylase [Paenibacillus sp. PastF-2]MDF9845982.1 succinyl-diaminopimelate desuccinylase [Paenibacillus sp. PastM-2]MDF9852555.1 succinyl-diaminopimelate desuccinylase [Paenibacillus sp. PastF-1]MDH6477715.1 succinyl-diaminopimelate desuccinylase [Paenibacillus sp. PastH-2]MDH6505454.1 succinyl-diaminopimelate desuccinylase [Paenibacillus sp. PastM-3]